MSGADASEKTFEPTPKKLLDARKKGDVAKSNDLSTGLGYLGFVLTLAFLGGSVANKFGQVSSSIMSNSTKISENFFSDGSPAIIKDISFALLLPLHAIFVGPALCVVLGLIAQRAVVFAPSKLRPKLSRVSPISIAKQKFGRAGLFEFLKSFTKLSVYVIFLGWFLFSQLPVMMGMLLEEPGRIFVEMINMLGRMALVVLLVSFSIGILDYFFQVTEYRRKNMMSRKEILDENKEAEGDPTFKQARRQKAVDFAMNGMMKDVETADVVIVNPTHYAVVLRWNEGSDPVPVCVAKGVDEIASKIREIANENSVPIYSDPPSARLIYATVEIGDEIMESQYAAVATAIKFARSIQKKVISV